jgi:transcriptional regulator with XRE-family HTH domain
MSISISGEVVRRLRRERGWTQEQLAEIAALSSKTIQRVERTGMCDLETRSALASVLEIELKQLDGEKKIQQAKKQDGDSLLFYHRLTSGNGIVEIFQDTYGYRFSDEDPRSRDDVEFISMHVQNIHDWSEIWSDIEPGSKINAIFELGEMLKEMEARGMWLFGLRTRTKFKFPKRDGTETEIPGAICNFHVAYADSKRIIVLDPSR